MSDQVDVSVVVPVRNGEATLLEQLNALSTQETSFRYEVLVVDNGSTDQTPMLARSFSERDARVRLLDAPDVAGVNNARRHGADHAAGAAILFCDADDIVDRSWIHEMTLALTRFDLVCGRIDENLLNGFMRNEDRTPYMWAPPTIELLPLPFAPGGCLGIRKHVLQTVGGWDRSYPAGVGGDDIELSWRCQLAGFTLGFACDAVLHLRHRRALREVANQSYNYGKSIPYLLSRFRRHGAQRRPLRETLRVWVSLARSSPQAARDRQSRRAWVASAAFAAGRVVASARFQTFAP